MENILLQKLDLNGVRTLVDWAAQEGWNPGPHDFEVFWKTDPEGFYGFYRQKHLIAGGAIISYQGNYGFMGLFIVHPDFRGLGLGKKLWYQRRDLLRQRLKKGAAIGMDGVVAMQPFYKKGGFKTAFTDARYERKGQTISFSTCISPIAPADKETLLAYDRQCFGVARWNFLEPWLQIPGSRSFKYVKDGKLKGYAVLRKAASGFKIGPLFADHDDIAEELYKACLNSTAGEKVFLDIPAIHQGAQKLVKKYGATYVFECARMYYGTPPKMAMEKIYGLTTFELG